MATTTVDLPELLEQILNHLDPRTLLLAQRVNSRFRSIISTRETLRTKLFYSLHPYSTPHDTIQMNPFLTMPHWLTNKLLPPTAWKFALDPFTLPPNSVARKMRLSSHVGVMQCLFLRGRSGDHEKTWTIPAESSEMEVLSCDYNAETLETFVAKTMDDRRQSHVGFCGFDFRDSIWLVDFGAESSDP
ncbi:hypothetical protein LTR95_000946 [Oleoguttula sp. CCFEE 5521]